jgi:hypothetical protein
VTPADFIGLRSIGRHGRPPQLLLEIDPQRARVGQAGNIDFEFETLRQLNWATGSLSTGVAIGGATGARFATAGLPGRPCVKMAAVSVVVRMETALGL